MSDPLIQPWTPEDKREYGRLADEAFRAKEALWHASQRLQDWLAEHPTTGWMDPEDGR